MKSIVNKRVIFILLILGTTFIIPMIISFGIYNYRNYFQFKTLNQGNLLSPVVPTNGLFESCGKPTKWRIVFFPADSNRAQNANISQSLIQIKKALGKNSFRVCVVLFGDEKIAQPKQMQLQKLFVDQKMNNFVIPNKIFLVDPDNNLFMYYNANTNPNLILKDLKRLLEISQIG